VSEALLLATIVSGPPPPFTSADGTPAPIVTISAPPSIDRFTDVTSASGNDCFTLSILTTTLLFLTVTLAVSAAEVPVPVITPPLNVIWGAVALNNLRGSSVSISIGVRILLASDPHHRVGTAGALAAAGRALPELAAQIDMAGCVVSVVPRLRIRVYSSLDMTRPLSYSDLSPIPTGKWAVGVSGGADSVALLLLLHEKPDLQLHVLHLNHELRGRESEMDAQSVEQLAGRLNLPCVIARRGELRSARPRLPANPSARYRIQRLDFFASVVKQQKLNGVLLAHHADDVAETVLQRLIRHSPPSGLRGIAASRRIGQLCMMRPLLNVRRQTLRDFLVSRGQDWREDSSNAADDYLRNRLRMLLTSRPDLTDALLALAEASRKLTTWTRDAAPELSPLFAAAQLSLLPRVLARAAARRWLIDAGSPATELSGAVLDRLREMAADAATPSRQEFPGRLTVHRRGGKILGAIS
jgi:tRNA(Ile)-lysidine synthetase-like protein